MAADLRLAVGMLSLAAAAGLTVPATHMGAISFQNALVTRASAPAMSASWKPARRDALWAAAASVLLAASPVRAEEVTTSSGLKYSVVKSGNGGQPAVGDLIAIRFKGKVAATGAVFDDILESPEPYYTRVGSGNVLAGVEEAVKLMHSGDTWDLTIPGDLAFGSKGRSASPGKPRIPPGAVIDFRLELVAVPGKDDDIIEQNGIID